MLRSSLSTDVSSTDVIEKSISILKELLKVSGLNFTSSFYSEETFLKEFEKMLTNSVDQSLEDITNNF